MYVCAPQDIIFTEDALFLRHDDGKEDRIDVLYRNFELFDLLNVPKQELMLYAARHNRVKMTPPPKAQFEEKSAFALLHHPLLEALWRKELTDDVFTRLRALFPQTWVLDPRPLPPQAAIVGLNANGLPVNDWMQLETLGKGERDYVVKPSGFSELAWGSRGVQIANDLTREEWHAALVDGLTAFDKTPHILQRFHKGRRVRVEYFDPASEGMRTMDGRVRLTPYYFVAGDAVRSGRYPRDRGAGRQAAHPRDERRDHGARARSRRTAPDRGRDAARRGSRSAGSAIGGARAAAMLVSMFAPSWLTGTVRAVAAYDVAALVLLAYDWTIGLRNNAAHTIRRAARPIPAGISCSSSC